jgi:hypothetical protein
VHDRELTPAAQVAAELLAETLIGHRMLLEALRKK